jgi:hypothetical protein
MKICWDNLERAKFTKNRSFFICTSSYYESDNPCKTCGEIFLSRSNKEEYCSKSCAIKSRDISEETRKKMNESQKNKIFSEETRKKMSEAAKGRKHTEETKRKMGDGRRKGSNNNLWKGGFCSENVTSYEQHYIFLESFHNIRNDNGILETKCTYCGKWYKPTYNEAKNRIKSISGDGGRNFYCSNECKHGCPIYNQNKYPKGYKVGSSREVQPELRKLVFERDNWSCVKCGIDKNLHCHHIDPVVNNPLESADIDNCITLCKECHKAVHKKDGCNYNELKGKKC